MKKTLLITGFAFIPAVALAGSSFWGGFGGAVAGNIATKAAGHVFSANQHCHHGTTRVVHEPRYVEVRQTVHEVVPAHIQQELHSLRRENQRLQQENESVWRRLETEQEFNHQEKQALQQTISHLERQIKLLERKETQNKGKIAANFGNPNTDNSGIIK